MWYNFHHWTNEITNTNDLFVGYLYFTVRSPMTIKVYVNSNRKTKGSNIDCLCITYTSQNISIASPLTLDHYVFNNLSKQGLKKNPLNLYRSSYQLPLWHMMTICDLVKSYSTSFYHSDFCSSWYSMSKLPDVIQIIKKNCPFNTAFDPTHD